MNLNLRYVILTTYFFVLLLSLLLLEVFYREEILESGFTPSSPTYYPLVFLLDRV